MAAHPKSGESEQSASPSAGEPKLAPRLAYPCVESTLEVLLGDRMVRLWLDRDAVPIILPAFRELAQSIKVQLPRLKPPEFMEWLRTETRARGLDLNAAQLVRRDPMDAEVMLGVVVYYVDFDGDPHG